MRKIVIDDTVGDMIVKIEQLEADNERLRAALQRLVTDYQDVPDPTDADGQAVFEDARRALEGGTVWPPIARETLVQALHEATTNGRWTEGEQCGEWAISREVYESLRDLARRALEGGE